MPKTNFLAIHLRARGGHCGRTNPELQRLADRAGLSIHAVQSMAIGRRTIGDEAKSKLREAIKDGLPAQ